MGLRYDFDILTVIPDELYANPKLMELLRQSGVQDGSAQNRIAVFRDARTAAALRAASPGVQAIFIDAGFGLHASDSPLPDGAYPATDEVFRHQILTKLLRNLRATHLTGEYGGAFDIAAFLADARTARPAVPAQTETVQPRRPAVAPQPEKSPRRARLRIGIAIVLAILVMLAARYLAGNLTF